MVDNLEHASQHRLETTVGYDKSKEFRFTTNSTYFSTIKSIITTMEWCPSYPCVQEPETKSVPDMIDRCDQAISRETAKLAEIQEVVEPSESLFRLNDQMKRIWIQRKLLMFILFVYVTIMVALLVILLILFSVYRNQSNYSSPQNRTITEGHYPHRSPVHGFIDDKLITAKDTSAGYLNAPCTKDSDCQTHMLCSGMADGQRRCHCQSLFRYDSEGKRCRKSVRMIRFSSACDSCRWRISGTMSRRA